MRAIVFSLCGLLAASAPAVAQDDHAGHSIGGSMFGRVHFATSCGPAVQESFDRAVAMLHSFFYPETEKAFRAVADQDPQCAMATGASPSASAPIRLTAPFPPALLKQGWENIEKARAVEPADAARARLDRRDGRVFSELRHDRPADAQRAIRVGHGWPA